MIAVCVIFYGSVHNFTNILNCFSQYKNLYEQVEFLLSGSHNYVTIPVMRKSTTPHSDISVLSVTRIIKLC